MMINKKRLLMLSGLSVGILVALPAFAVMTISEQLKLLGGNDVNTNNNTGWIVNDSAGQQMGIDTNEIQTRVNSVASSLHLNAGGGAVITGSDLDVGDDLDVAGTIFYTPPQTGATIHLCWSSVNDAIEQCGSSIRFKTDVTDLRSGLREVMAMKPVSFVLKASGEPGLGFIAEDSAAVLPELVEYTGGEVSGFNYSHYTAVLTRAVQEQQKTIEDQRVELNTTQQAVVLRDKEIAKLQTEVAELQKLRDDVKSLSRAVASMTAR